MNKLSRFFIAALSIYFLQVSVIAQAQNQFSLNTLQSGQLLLNISAVERVEVDQDTLNISLQYITTGQNRVALQNEVNTVMAAALDILQDSSGIEYSIEQYQVYMSSSRNNPPSNIDQQEWRAQQSLQLTSLDSDAVLDLAGKLQEIKLNVSNIYYSLSTEQFESVSDSLLNAALIKLQGRANAAADSLDKNSAELVEVTVNGNGGPSYPRAMRGVAMMEMSSADSDFSRPVAQPGKTEVSLTVSARALLSP